MDRMFTEETAARPAAALRDAFGREVSYLRLSVTDRNNLRGLSSLRGEVPRLPKSDLLTLEELERLCDAFIRLGVRKIRLTGGEPLLRGGIMGFIERLGTRLASGRLQALCLTTNGTLLARHAEALFAAGVRSVNVALDTLDESTFRRIARRPGLAEVLAGIEAARAAGLAVRVNLMALAGINDGEFDHLIHWCGERRCDLALIEAMPGSDLGADHYLPLDVVNWHLSSRWNLIPIANLSGGPCRSWLVAETGCRLGFIAPLSHPFCKACNRVEVSCTGSLAACIARRGGGTDLRSVLRGADADTALEAAIAAAIAARPESHRFAAGGRAGEILPVPQARG